ncbi:hypothetical protein EDD16DRAFT_1580050 [Pisolithus croceorrhizus]|nr:hypothetical protein EDD16DRAFT_1580050 [Pisolithus croceorrhizus]
MSWPAEVVCRFQLLLLSRRGLHGAYNKLLHVLFPPDTCFTVEPHYLEPSSSQSHDSIHSFDILLGTRPVFVPELMVPTDLTCKLSRQSADEQIREHLGDLAS